MKHMCSGVKIICVGLLSVLICVRMASAELVLQGTNTVDVGLISQYDKRKVEFLFRNKGDKSVRIVDLVATCACISAVGDRERVEPGQELRVEVNLDPATVHNKFKRIVWLVADSAGSAGSGKVPLAVIGEVQPLFRGLPSSPVPLRFVGADVAFTNDFELTCIYTNFIPQAPKKYIGKVMEIDAHLKRTGLNAYHLRTVVVLKSDTRAMGALRIPVAAPIEVQPLRLSFRTAGSRRSARSDVSADSAHPAAKRGVSFTGRGGRTFTLPPPGAAALRREPEKSEGKKE